MKRIISFVITFALVFCFFVTPTMAASDYERINDTLDRNDGTDSYSIYAVTIVDVTSYDNFSLYEICRTGGSGDMFHMSIGSSVMHDYDQNYTGSWKDCRRSSATGTNEMTYSHYCSSSCNGSLKRVIGRYSINDCYTSISSHLGDINSDYEQWWNYTTYVKGS